MIKTQLDGFTPIIDTMAERYGLVGAAVFGIVWRHCQMKRGVCDASIGTMAEKIGASTRTIQRHLRQLCTDGYLVDLTPDLNGRPHTYQDTGKAGLAVVISASEPMTQSHTTYDTESYKDTIEDTIPHTPTECEAQPADPTPEPQQKKARRTPTPAAVKVFRANAHR